MRWPHSHWGTKTKIKLVERTGANTREYLDYVSFEDRGSCYSDVGRQGARQVISIGPNCPTGAVIHEIGHAVGLWHEHSRSDRDAHVVIKEANIKPSELYNFQQHIQDGDDLGPYDYGSIMHYPKNAFSKNQLETIVPKNGAPIGQRTALSQGDLDAVKAIYPELYR